MDVPLKQLDFRKRPDGGVRGGLGGVSPGFGRGFQKLRPCRFVLQEGSLAGQKPSQPAVKIRGAFHHQP